METFWYQLTQVHLENGRLNGEREREREAFIRSYDLCCVYSEVGGRTQYRLLCKDAGGDTEQTMLHETVPTWVVDVTVQVIAVPSLSN